jgi:MYXO-CTERM domain-containing protein
LANSYYVLSSPYARPDLTWPVNGTVELRDAQGQVVEGVSAKRLRVKTVGAELVDSVKLVRAGMYRFAFAAPPGSGGTTATVEVLLDGISLGVRELPVGVDAWAAGSGVKPVGGCSCAVPARESEGGWGVAVLLGLAMLRRRGRN